MTYISGISATAYLQLITGTSTKLGTVLPTKFLEATDKIASWKAAAGDYERGHQQTNIARIVAESIRSGKNPTDNKEVLAALVGKAATGTGLNLHIDDLCNEDYKAAITEHADELIGSWAAVMDTHAKALHAADEHFDFDGLDPLAASSLVGASPERIQAWSDAQIAVTAWRSAAEGTAAVLIVSGHDINGTTSPMVFANGLTAAKVNAFKAKYRKGGAPEKLTAWYAVKSGATLELATSDVYAARVNVYNKATSD